METLNGYSKTQPLSPPAVFDRKKVIVTACATLVLLGAFGFYGFRAEREKHRRFRSQIAQLQQENDRLKEQAKGTGYNLEAVREDSGRAKESLGRFKGLANNLKTQIKGLLDADWASQVEIGLAYSEIKDAERELSAGLEDMDRRVGELGSRLAKWTKPEPASASALSTPEQAAEKRARPST